MKGFRFWRRHFLGVEAAAVLLATFGFAVWYLWIGGCDVVGELVKGNRANVYRTTATIAGSMLGFSITSTSVIVAVSSREGLRTVRESGQYQTLWKTLLQTVWGFAGLTVVSIVCLVFDKDVARMPEVVALVSFLVIVFLFFLCFSVARLIRTIWILDRVARILSQEGR